MRCQNQAADILSERTSHMFALLPELQLELLCGRVSGEATHHIIAVQLSISRSESVITSHHVYFRMRKDAEERG